MNFKQFSVEIEKKLDNIYVIKGDDDFLIQKAIEKIATACGVDFPDLDMSRFDSENFDGQTLMSCLEQLPFSAKKRIVVVKNLTKISEQDKTRMKEYATSPNPSTCLVLSASNGYENFSFITKSVIVECFKLDFPYLQKYIVGELEKLGKKISEPAVKMLVEYTSSNMTRISSEVQKLSTAYCQNDMITSETVSSLVTKDNEYQIFELSTALAERDGQKAFQIVKLMLERKEDPSMILGLISSHFRRMFHAKISDMSNAEIAGMFGVKEYAVKKARDNSSSFSQKGLKKINDLLCDVDFMMKSGEMSSENVIYFLIFQILSIK